MLAPKRRHRAHRSSTVTPDKPTRALLTLREITDNLAVTPTAVTAWYLLPEQRWSFRTDPERRDLIYAVGRRFAQLAGYNLHIRVTSRPYPTGLWARNLHHNTPHPLPPADGHKCSRPCVEGAPCWSKHLAEAQGRVQAFTLSDKEVYIGVEVSTRGVADRMVGVAARGTGDKERARLAAKIARVTTLMAGDGLGAAPCTNQQVEWLMHRSVGLGLPAPAKLSAASLDHWTTSDLHAFTDPIIYRAKRGAKTVTVRTDRNGAPITRHVAVCTMGRMDEFIIPESGTDPWMVYTDRLPFPVEWSGRVRVLSGDEAKGNIDRYLLRIRDVQHSHLEHDLDEPLALERGVSRAKQVEDEMATGDDLTATRVHGWWRIAVAGRTEDECLERVQELQDTYRRIHMDVAHPRGQFSLLREFTPGEPLGSTAHKRELPVLYAAAGLPQVTATVGDRRGSYLGSTCGASRRAVMWDPWYSTETKQLSGLVAVIGGLGAGKSSLVGATAYEAARRGITTTVLDPSGPLARLTELPELAGHARHIDLLHAPHGTLNPYLVIPTPRRQDYRREEDYEAACEEAILERRELAKDVINMLLTPSVRGMRGTELVIAAAVRGPERPPPAPGERPAPNNERNGSLWNVVKRLEKMHGKYAEHATTIAHYLRDMAEMPQAKLFFGQPVANIVDRDATLLVLTMAGLMLPDKNVPPDQWTMRQRLAVPVQHLAAHFATRRVYGRSLAERKMIVLDEVGQMGNWGTGLALFNRLGRDSRKWNTSVVVCSQSPRDVLGLDVADFLKTAFVGRIEDEKTATEALRLLGITEKAGYERVLAGLSPTVRDQAPGAREFIMRDPDGGVEKMRVDLGWNPGLLAALDTTAKPVTRANDSEDEDAA
jgi:hypothetical protein